MTNKIFPGLIPVSNSGAIGTISPYAETSWSNDTTTTPGNNPASYSETAWSNDDGSTCFGTFAILIEES